MEVNGQKIRSLRRRRRWSAQELAEAAGIPDHAIYRYETGRSSPSDEEIQKIAEAFGVDVQELLMTEEDDTPSYNASKFIEKLSYAPDPRIIEAYRQIIGNRYHERDMEDAVSFMVKSELPLVQRSEYEMFIMGISRRMSPDARSKYASLLNIVKDNKATIQFSNGVALNVDEGFADTLLKIFSMYQVEQERKALLQEIATSAAIAQDKPERDDDRLD